MYISTKVATVGLLVAGFVAPVAAFAAAPTVTSVSSDNLILTSHTPNPFLVTVTFDQEVSTPTITIAEGSLAQTVTDCGDTSATTYCFAYSIPQDIEAGVFKNVLVSAAQNSGSEVMTATTLGAHRFIVDSFGPFVTVPRTVRNTTLPTISGFTTEANSPVTVTVNNATYVVTPSAGIWTVTIPTGSALAEGSYIVTAVGSDPFNNPGAPAQGELIIDLTAPDIAVTGIGNNTATTSTTVTNQFEVNDALAVAITCAYDGELFVTCSPNTAYATTTSPGLHTFTVIGNDEAGNQSVITVHFAIDITPPTLTEVAPIPTGTLATPTYYFTSSEAGTLTYGGACSSASKTTATVGTNAVTFDSLIPDTYTSCTLTVRDAAGNASTLAVSPFTITAVVPPVISPTRKEQCKDDGWRDFINPAFKNQGQCIQYVNTGR